MRLSSTTRHKDECLRLNSVSECAVFSTDVQLPVGTFAIFVCFHSQAYPRQQRCSLPCVCTCASRKCRGADVTQEDRNVSPFAFGAPHLFVLCLNSVPFIGPMRSALVLLYFVCLGLAQGLDRSVCSWCTTSSVSAPK